ncbi:MAG: hypothetical protein ABFQ65_02475 [Nanoarchaeota archaeon]
MTTVFGLKHPEVNSAVLVADRQATSINDKTGIPSGKFLGRKLWVSNNEDYCFGHSGNRDNGTQNLVQKLSEGKIDVEKIITKKYFSELRKLNIKRMGGKFPDPQQMSGIILATRFEKIPKLYSCFPLGDVEERVWTCAGSGDQKIAEYMQALQVMSEAKDYLNYSSKIELMDVIRVGLEAVRRSQNQDLYSSGLDMMVCTPEKIIDHYAELGDDFGKKLKKIQNKYK